MKRFLLLLVATLTMTCGFSQNRSWKEVKEHINSSTISLSEEERDVHFAILEYLMFAAVDSIKNEGRFMQALETIDSIQANWKYVTGRELSTRMYETKVNILLSLEEYGEVVKTTEECLSVHKSDIDDRAAAYMYSQQGNAHIVLKEYLEAIRSKENSLYYHTKTGDIGSQGAILCSMAYCYSELGKYTTAFSFYEKGINKFLDYFETSRSVLLRSDFSVKDPYNQNLLDMFAMNLFYFAVLEQDHGSKLDSKNYLLMSAHCGYAKAKSEYQRIYGDR